MTTYHNHLNGPGGDIRYSGDVTNNTNNNSKTTNHIYLGSYTNQGEYDSWMRQIGSLLHVSAQHASLKPILDLIMAAIEPDRIFLLDNPAIPEYQVFGCTEIILAIDMDKAPSKKMLDGILKFCCTRMQDVVLSFHPSQQVEDGLAGGHPYYSTHCREEFLVFSGSCYRLPKTPETVLPDLKAEIMESYKESMARASAFLENAKAISKKQSHNPALVMLHQCFKQLFTAITHSLGKDCPTSDNLIKLKRKAERYLPQLQPYVDENVLAHIDGVRKSTAGRYLEAGEVFETASLLDDTGELLKAVGVIFDHTMERMFGNTPTLPGVKPKSAEPDGDGE
ncbi:hypothetical protein [Parapedobacter koreensis]|uniref:HEPN domain-containing protein n=1 Tax=Parapedobacter koreensis TaxID=332977 RepID=A0A1H7P4P8_9SPHI|nr:hypothetical protein [Parapedobacter koreensis]SEL30860.1 hypothetical protein SAMN05421740_104216 [Parapedobacter koreensis]